MSYSFKPPAMDSVLQAAKDVCDVTSGGVIEKLRAAIEPFKLRQFSDGEWVTPKQKGFLMQCCNCNFVHRINFRIRKGKIQFQAFRAKSQPATDATANLRLVDALQAITKSDPYDAPSMAQIAADALAKYPLPDGRTK